MTGIAGLASTLERGEKTAVTLAEEALARIADSDGEGSRVFVATDPARSLAEAAWVDHARASGTSLPRLAGIPVSIKALFDLEGQKTTAGSKVLCGAPPAVRDAAAVARLVAAGMVVTGHTNMTEFAYSGLGLNPHYGTPGNPADRSRIPGGSSSGAAVSVADGMAAAGLGTDTGGSCRIPAAFCGLTGFKPTARRVPADGCFPLSPSFDSIGSITRSVECCALLDAVLAGEPLMAPDPVGPAGLPFGVLDNYVTEDLEPEVASAFDAALAMLDRAGARLHSITLPDLDRLPQLNAEGGIVAAEAWALHGARLTANEHAYDPRVAIRIRKGAAQRRGEYAALLDERRRMIGRAAAVTGEFVAILMPTVPMVAPRIADLKSDEALYDRTNLLALRNPTIANFLDRCAISLPLPVTGLPVGLTMMGEAMSDRVLLAIARGVDAVLTA